MLELHDVIFTLNGSIVSTKVEPRINLADFLRQHLGLSGTHVGCEHGVCGACTILVNGRTVRSCLMLAVQADGLQVQTIEGLTEQENIADLQNEFVSCNALQCGFCTSGVLATAVELLGSGHLTRKKIRDALSGNYCRCTGYHTIVDAIYRVAMQRQARRS